MPVRSVCVVVALLLAAGAAVAQERVVNAVSTDQIEQLLKGMNLEFKKSQAKIAGNFWYDFNFAKNRVSSRLHFFQGKDMMLDHPFPEQPLEKLNEWNATRARLSRASLHKEAKVPFTLLEANLNFVGGVTDNTVRRFIRDFEEEIAAFDRFVNKTEIQPPKLDPAGDKIFTLTSDKLEEIIVKMKLTTKPKQSFNGNFYYDYESPRNYKIRLTNFSNNDLMLDAVFKKIPLETINKYNFNRKFIRAVLYNQGNSEYTALEANLDCSVGVSENMIRHYMVTFDEEVQNFVEFMNKN